MHDATRCLGHNELFAFIVQTRRAITVHSRTRLFTLSFKDSDFQIDEFWF